MRWGKKEGSGKQWGKDKGRQRLTPEAQRQNLITISQMKITRFQALHRAKPCWRLTLSYSLSVLLFFLSHNKILPALFPLRFCLSLSLTFYTMSYFPSPRGAACILFNISLVTRLNCRVETQPRIYILIGPYYGNVVATFHPLSLAASRRVAALEL